MHAHRKTIKSVKQRAGALIRPIKLTNFSQEKKEKTKKNRLPTSGMKQGVITADLTDIKRIMREYYKQLYTYKFDNWDEMGPIS